MERIARKAECWLGYRGINVPDRVTVDDIDPDDALAELRAASVEGRATVGPEPAVETCPSPILDPSVGLRRLAVPAASTAPTTASRPRGLHPRWPRPVLGRPWPVGGGADEATRAR